MAIANEHRIPADSAACLATGALIFLPLPELGVVGTNSAWSREAGFFTTSLDSIRVMVELVRPCSQFSALKRPRKFCESPMAVCSATHSSLSIFADWSLLMPIRLLLDLRLNKTDCSSGYTETQHMIFKRR